MAVKCPMKEAGNGHGAALQTGLCASQVRYSLGKHRVSELVSNSYQFLGLPICFLRCQILQISFQMTHCITNDGT